MAKRIRFVLFFSTMLFVSASVLAQKVKVSVSVPKVVAVNEPFQLVYTINEQPSGFQQPDLSEFLFSGPSTSRSFSTSIINGKMTEQKKFSYTYVIQAQKAGKFTIPQAKFIVDGKTHTANPVKIEVVKGSKPTAKKKQGQQANGVSENDLYVRVHLSKSSVYQGEHIVATIKLYTRVSVAGFKDVKLPSFTGFWSQEIENPKHIDLKRENVDGMIYEVGVLRKNLLFPQSSGKIKIDPVEIEAIVRYRVRPQSFWDDGFREMTKKIKSAPITVNVKSLPAPQPDDFTGAVGNFSLKTTFDKTEVKTNDAITMKVNVSGNGNLRLINEPKINFPPDFEVYDPKINQNIKSSAAGAKGSKTFEYIIIPRHKGTFSVPGISISYFDTKTKSYETVSSKETTIEVAQGEGSPNVATDYQSFSKPEVKNIQSDIRYIKTENTALSERGSGLFNSGIYWGYFTFFTILFGAFVALKQKQIKENQNASLVRNKRASKVSQKRLKQAKAHMDANEKEAFFEEVLRATWGYLSDKMGIDVADLNKDNVREELAKHNIDGELTERLQKVIETCEFARYAPVADTEIGDTFNEASDVINTIDQKIR